MLTYKRPHGSLSEQKFIEDYLKPLGCRADRYGNMIKRVKGDYSTIFACHIDTVHRNAGYQRVFQNNNILSTDGNTVLGGDDTAGVWLCANLLSDGVPGLYIFHRAEEIGGIGSSDVVSRKNLSSVKRVISLDRKGMTDLITHQFGQRTCSDEFADELIRQLRLSFRKTSGTFTDSANYAEAVPECTNLSVGYEGAHTTRETLNARFLETMYHRLKAVNWRKLPVVRDPHEVKRKSFEWQEWPKSTTRKNTDYYYDPFGGSKSNWKW